jgi:hypothetical protein
VARKRDVEHETAIILLSRWHVSVVLALATLVALCRCGQTSAPHALNPGEQSPAQGLRVGCRLANVRQARKLHRCAALTQAAD